MCKLIYSQFCSVQLLGNIIKLIFIWDITKLCIHLVHFYFWCIIIWLMQLNKSMLVKSKVCEFKTGYYYLFRSQWLPTFDPKWQSKWKPFFKVIQSVQKYCANKVMHLIERLMAIHLVVTRLFVTDRCRITSLQSELWWLVAEEKNKALNHCHSSFPKCIQKMI